ncbi:MAG: hypothetical protein M1816_006488 [Peltula sp. TS41687]|nr:MAG: hypothetical protein M1816_006488 [Peltula sp. TS41687]
MFIGGLNWETTDLSLKNYFSQFGEVLDCTVMRDGSTGRSRGFGFLTFKDPKTVNSVMVKEHYLDGKIVRTAVSTSKIHARPREKSKSLSSQVKLAKIDPKRAIPRDEQERTSKIFVGGVSQEATEQEFKEFFMQFGRVLDATLMIDKDTGRPRGFGFVTFDSEAAVESALSQPLEIHGKAIEVKKAQPRGNVRDNDEDRSDRRFNRRGRDNHDRFDRDNNHRHSENSDQEQDKGQGSGQTQQAGQGLYAGMTPQMMAQYWQRMQQYFALMTQQMAAAQTQGLANPMAMATGMNPAMLQQLTALQAMSRQSSQGAQSPQSPGAQAMQGMNPAMMQQLQQMQQMQQMQQQQQQQAQVVQQQQANFGAAMPAGGNMGGFNNGGRVGPGYNAYEQQLFEQRKYEQQQARRAARDPQQAYQQPFQGGMTSWEGMYDDVPQPNMGMQQGFQRQMTPNQGQGGGGNRQHSRGSQGLSPAPPSTAPANAPTGPKNAGKPGANYRGGGRGGNRFHPYSRP